MRGTLVLDIEIGSEAGGIVSQVVQLKLQRVVGRLEAEILTDLSEKQWQLNLFKLFHDEEDALAILKKAQDCDPQHKPREQVWAEIHFEAWFSYVTKALENTKFRKL